MINPEGIANDALERSEVPRREMRNPFFQARSNWSINNPSVPLLSHIFVRSTVPVVLF